MPVRLWRFAIASALGGIFSVASLFLELPSPLPIILDLTFCIFMCFIAFYSKHKKVSSIFIMSGLYFGISMLMGGIITALFNLLNRLHLPLDKIDGDGISVWLFALLAILAGVISLSGSKFISKRSGARSVKVKIFFNGRVKEFCGLVDSGNIACDPISGKNIIIVDKGSADGLIDMSVIDNFISGNITDDRIYSKMRLIPINTVGGKGFMVAIRPDKIVINQRSNKDSEGQEYITDSLFAISDIGNSAYEYNAIVPSEILHAF